MPNFSLVIITSIQADNAVEAAKVAFQHFPQETFYVREDNDGETLDSDQLIDRGYIPYFDSTWRRVVLSPVEPTVQSLLCAKWNVPAAA